MPETSKQSASLTPPSTSLRLDHVVTGVAGVARLVDYLKDRLVLVPVTEVGDLITSGFVTIGIGSGEVGGRTGDLVADGDRIAISAAALAALEAGARWNPPWQQALSIRHEDDDLLVLEKPAGMHVHPLGDRRERTLVNALVHHAGGRPGLPWANWRPHVVQRLDFVVSGLLAVAKNAESKTALVRAQKRREVTRTYRAMVVGLVEGEAGVIDSPLGREPGRGYRRAVVTLEQGGRSAITRWRVVERQTDRTLVELEPETGRTHQLRAHLASMGYPIIGDFLYQTASGADAPAPARLGDHTLAAIALHATHLTLRHPRSGEVLEFDSPLPSRFGAD